MFDNVLGNIFGNAARPGPDVDYTVIGSAVIEAQAAKKGICQARPCADLNDLALWFANFSIACGTLVAKEAA